MTHAPGTWESLKFESKGALPAMRKWV